MSLTDGATHIKLRVAGNDKEMLMPTGVRRYRSYGPPPLLPDPETLPFPGALVRTCRDCNLGEKCRAPVPGENINPEVDAMLVGQGPGKNEDIQGRPFVGAAGEYLDSLLFQARIPRDTVAITNLVKCLTPGNRQPSPLEIRTCSKWLDLEVDTVDPYIIVTMGAPATAHFLGLGAGSMEQLNGKPIPLGGRVILPMYHPAAALHDTSKLRQCSEAFQVLRELVNGSTWRAFHVRDEYPNPEYRVADTPGLLRRVRDETRDSGEFGLDTEQCRGDPWSYQVSAYPGTGWFVPIKGGHKGRVNFADWPATAIVHNYLYDIQYIKLRDHDFVDSMVLAYLVGEVQGLKELGRRLCGVPMSSYREIVRLGQQKLSMEYLFKALEQEWPDPPLIEETKWDNKKGEIVTRQKKPWHISRKMNKMLNDMEDNYDLDLWTRWRSIPAEERVVVESVLGAMPESSLADIDRDEAVFYSVRDSDVTLRIYHKLMQIIDKLGLNFVQYTDLGILPMVNDMMANGMAVDLDHYRRLSGEYDHRLRLKAAELAAMVGHSFNPASSQQVATVIYDELGFKPTKFTATGLISTDDAELKKTSHPVAEGVIRYRGIQKLKGTYADALIEWAVPDQLGVPRVHTTLKTTRVETGRLSSSDPNQQNIPTRSKEARAIKNGFIAPTGKRLLEGDLAQIEQRVQAHLANCRGLIELFNRSGDEGDPHTVTASKIFGVPIEEAKRDKYRRPAKCFHPDTEVLTPRGWTRIVDLRRGDKVMQAIPGDYGRVSMEWVVPTEVFTTHHSSGRLVHLKNYGMNLRVTPDHRMLAWQTKKHRVVSPYEINKQRYWANAGVYSGGIEVDERILRLAVATEADGSFSWRKIRFGFYNSKKIRRLNDLAGNDVVSSVCSNGGNRPVHAMCLSRELSSQVRELLDVNKSFPWWWLELTPRLRSVVLDELKNWDGGVYKWGNETIYSSGNGKSKDVIQAIAAITERKTSQIHTESHSRGKTYPICEVTVKDHALTRGENLTVTEYDYTGEVACLLVPSTFVLVRDGGIPVITGQTMGFGIIYMIGAYGLSTQINEYIADLKMEGEPVEIEPWDEERCAEFIGEYYKLYPEIRVYQRTQLAHARRRGYVQDMFGRVRYIPEVSCPIRSIQEAGARMAANFAVTASAQNIIKMAMVEIWDGLPGTPWEGAKTVMQIHDSLLFEIPDDEDFVHGFLPWVRGIMTGVAKLAVPIEVDFKMGKRWGSMEKYTLTEE